MISSSVLWRPKKELISGVSDFSVATRILTTKDKRKLFYIAVIQIMSASLDIIGILLIGLVGNMTVSSLKKSSQSETTLNIVEALKLQNLDPANQAAVLVVIAVLCLVARTIFSAFFTKKILFYFAHQSSQVSTSLYSNILEGKAVEIRTKPIQETLFAVTKGVDFLAIQVFASSMVVLSDLSLLTFIFVGILVIDPITALGTIVLFGAISYVLMHRLHARVHKLGVENTTLNIGVNSDITESLGNYRESFVANRFAYYKSRVSSKKAKLASITAELNFLPYTGKYVIEIAILVGASLIGGFQFLVHDTSKAISIFVIFLAAGTRIAPAVMRIQQSLIQIRGGLSMAGPTLRLIENYFDKDQSKLIFNVPKFDTNHKGFKPTIKLENVNFQYTKESNFGMENINLRLNPGNFIGIVGQSGAGKSTLVDLLLGVLSPSSGTVRISDTSAIDAIGTWPGAISYVPQEVKIINGSIRENVIVGYAKEDVSDSDIWKVLEKVSLSSFVNSLPRKLDEEINESGSNLSGGQKQRLGLARAWITNPKILILDEATSSLDAETENFISDILNSDRSDRIVISIAHRLTSIRLADSIIYVENGKIEASGNFEELRKISKKFDNQANLMGL